MKIGGFYIVSRGGNKSCSDPQHKTEAACRAAGKLWDYHPPAWEEYTPVNNIPDKKGADFYWTGVLKKSFTGGAPADFNYRGEFQVGTNYLKGDLVYFQEASTSNYYPEKIWYYCIQDHTAGLSISQMSITAIEAKWERLNLKSYIYEGESSATIEPDAWHVYDTKQNKRTHRYNEGGNPAAKLAEMGPTDVKLGRNNFKTYFNQENDPKQFYLASLGSFEIYETCHGTRPLEFQGISGNFNFYNASYPAGYYAPPYGETPTLTLIGSSAENETINALTSTDFTLENFMAGNCCPQLDDPGEMGMWGIRTVFPQKGPMVSYDHNRGDEHGIHAPGEECPPDLPPQYFFEEQKFGYHPGSIMAPGAGTFYNDNPFPNSTDINGWVSDHVYKTQRCFGGGGIIYNGYKLDSGYPKLMYPVVGSKESKLEAGICKARQCETSQLLGYNFAGVQLGFASGPGAATNDSASFATYDPFTYWHFIFRYNHDSLWNETQNTLTNKVTSFAHSEGQAEEHMWEYRQCPNTPDFLPWSSDNPIHACPSHYFDIPYYAAIGKFGFYGARFFNSCSTPNAETVDETEVEDQEFNYYTARKISSDGVTFEQKVYEFKGLASVTLKQDSTLRINNGCYEVKYIETSTDDRAVDLVLSSTSPSWQDRTETVDLKYDVYEWKHTGGVISFNLNTPELVETITWDSVSFSISACQDCLDGGAAAIDAARQTVISKLESKFGVSLKTMLDDADGVGRNYCSQSPACDPYIMHDSVVFNPRTSITEPLQHFDDLINIHALRAGADNIHASDGKYSTVSARINLVRDFPAGVQDCTEYQEPRVKGGVCEEDHYKTLLEIARNEQRIGEFFAGNIGFFLWANYDHIVETHEYKNLLTGYIRNDEAEIHFKSCLFRLKKDFDQMLLSLPNLLNGLDDPVVYYKAATNGMFGNETLDYSRQGLFNDMLFTNNRYRQFLKETEWDTNQNLFALAVKPQDNPSHKNQIDAWNQILTLYGSHIAVPGGQVNQEWYKTAVEGKEKRILTRFVENKLRGRAIDLFPTNQITFSTDSASPYITGKHWGNSKWGDSVVNSHQGANFDPLPGGAHYEPPADNPDQENPDVTRRYFHGVYTHVSTVTGWHDRIEYARSLGGAHYYGGLFQDFSCGGDRPIAAYRDGGRAVGAEGKDLPISPWAVAGYNDVGRINQGFSCFSPIFTQQPLNVTCKIGQRPTFRAQAVDYHTIPEDKINKGYPEIDFWTNNLKLTNTKGELKYPVHYKWYRIKKSVLSPTNPEETLDELFYSDIPEYFQEASVTGDWACLEGISGVGNEDCTLYHPQATYTHEMSETEEEVNGVPIKYKMDTNYNGRKYGVDHWSKLVDYKGESHYINSSKKDGEHRLWKAYSYIQGAITYDGRMATDRKNLPAIPTFSKTNTYSKMMEDKYGLQPSKSAGDDEYLYFCVSSGRFGFRRSEYVNLDIEDWVKQDYSVRNGAPISMPMQGVGFSYTRVDQEEDPLPKGALNEDYDELMHPWDTVFLSRGWGSHYETYGYYDAPELPIPPFAGLQRDPNQVWENEVMEKINMSNNCRSFAFVGREGYRGTTRTFRPPVQSNIQGDMAERAGWFEYGLLYSFGTSLDQSWGNALYSQSQMPICRDKEMPKGCTAQGFEVFMDLRSMVEVEDQGVFVEFDACGNPSMQTQSVNLVAKLSENLGASTEEITQHDPRMYHWSVLQPALIVDNLRAGVPNTQQTHHGEHYNYADEMGHTFGGYCGDCLAHHGRGVTWQFENNLGAIKRFGLHVPLPSVLPNGLGEGSDTYEDTPDVAFWAWRSLYHMKREFDAAKRNIRSTSLAGVNCGWRMKSCGRFMLYFVEALHRYYSMCSAKKKQINMSYIAPGLRAGSSANQYFIGGFPSDTYVKRNGLIGPYAYEWKVATHNRDRNGNGASQSFYSMKHERPMRLYDAAAIYGLWARQTPTQKVEPDVETVRKLRNRAQGPTASRKFMHDIKGIFFGPPGSSKNGGCGSFRIRCVETLHQKWRRPYRYGSGDEICDWYTYAERLGIDRGHHYGCSEEQLLQGVCFDPCLSMKYNYGFFPGGKLLTINNYVKYRDSRHNKLDDAETASGMLGTNTATTSEETTTTTTADPVAIHNEGARFMTQLTNDVQDEETAITKYKSFKFVRMLRGPWATPYRRVKATIIQQLFQDLGSNITNSDVLNSSKTVIPELPVEGVKKYGKQINRLPYPKRVSSVYTDTTVSPCNSGGADHCNYITPTMHLGMDVKIEGFQSIFQNTAGEIGGRYEPTSDFTPASEFLSQMDGFTKFLVNTWDSAMGQNPFVDGNGNPLSPNQTLSVLGEMDQRASLQTLTQYMQDNCDGKAGTFFGNILSNMGKFWDSATTTQLEKEIARRSENSVNMMVLNSILISLDGLHRQGRLVVI